MNKHQLILITITILLPLFLLILSYKLVLAFADLSEDQQSVIDYLQKEKEINPGFSQNELSHLQDVKEVMKWVDYFFYFSLLVITLIVTYSRRNKEQLVKFFKYGGISALIFITAIILSSILFFNQVFTLFHILFFPQGNWTFPGNSLLIQTFPLEFFMGISRNIFLLTLAEGILFILLFLYLRNDLKNKRP